MTDSKSTAKDYVLALLDEFIEDRPLAKGLKVLVNSWNMDDKMLDGLAQIFQSVVHNVSLKADVGKFKKGLEYLEKVRNLEKQAQEQDTEELDELLDEI